MTWIWYRSQMPLRCNGAVAVHQRSPSTDLLRNTYLMPPHLYAPHYRAPCKNRRGSVDLVHVESGYNRWREAVTCRFWDSLLPTYSAWNHDADVQTPRNSFIRSPTKLLDGFSSYFLESCTFFSHASLPKTSFEWTDNNSEKSSIMRSQCT